PAELCNPAEKVAVRYAASTERVYLESPSGDPGCVTLTDIWFSRAGKGPLYAVNPITGARSENATGTWLLTESLYVVDGNVLIVHGGDGGDCDELRLLSNKTSLINLRAHGGSLSFVDTKVFSWDEQKNTYDTNTTDGRSYISALSEVIYDPTLNCSGMALNEMGEARMDIVRSEIGYLGYYDSESYGLTWKVRGFCVEKTNKEVFDYVNVYGDVIESDIHHNYFGMYTYGHQQGNWSNNLMHDNEEYGFDPHDDSDYLTIHDNKVWSNGNHGIIASKRCNNVSIQNNEVWDSINAGLFLHRSSDGAIVKGNYVHDNGDAGMAMLESFDNLITENVFENNRYGIRLSVGCGRNTITNNIFTNSSKYQLYTYQGSDLPDVLGTTGRPLYNIFSDNTITKTGEDCVKIKEADYTVIKNNLFEDVLELTFTNSTETSWHGNTLDAEPEFEMNGYACMASDSDPSLAEYYC
ncbi:unnamed protein product, partial [Choristocarpus tenellus]